MLGSWSPGFCKAYFFILGGCGLALLFAVEGALQLRIYVMFVLRPRHALSPVKFRRH